MRQNFSTYTDEKLVFLLRSDSKEESEIAFTEVYNRYSSRVHAYCLRVLNDYEQAEDIFQEVFIRFFQKIKSNYPETNVSGYLIKIARNLCLNYKRDKVNTINIQENDIYFEPGKSFENSELLDLITTALELLDFDYKEAFVMREYDGLSYNEIAEVTNTTVTNAKSRVFRAKQKIKEILQPYLKDMANNEN
ncbi:MAG: RNA polymerase sigma factor [Ignavibacteriae bacterium]|nr:RNA polymerase sigma factor [Ignavibacteriota bacterium]